MQISYLDTATQGLLWLRRYYLDRPELNANAAIDAMLLAQQMISEFPYAGQKFEGARDVFEKKISKTAFSILYTVREDVVFIIDMRDQRGFRSAHAIGAHIEELERKLGIERP